MSARQDAVHEPQHEHEFEAELGLPEPLPAGERLLWQGAPDVYALAERCFHVRTAAGYFGVILSARAATVWVQGGSPTDGIVAALWLLPAALVALAMLGLMSWLVARTTVYTLTDQRVVMRIGIVLSLTFNLPLRQIDAAAAKLTHGEFGDIALTLAEPNRIAYVHLWPHARPWRIAKTQPMLRCLPDAERVAHLLTEAWSAARGLPVAPVAASPATVVTEQPVPRPASASALVHAARRIDVASAAR